ncbi:MAG: phospholipase D family protein [Thermoguttaceae bacterium]
MKRLPALALLLACLLPGCGPPRPLPPMEIYFSPKGGCTEAVVQEIERARQTILVQAYSFTSAPIAEALVDAHKRGVQMHVILDVSNRKENTYSAADFLLHAGIPVMIDARHAIAHNKIMVIDDEVVLTGSFNFTSQAEHSNAENLLVIRDTEIAGKYAENWRVHAGHSEPYEGRSEGQAALHRHTEKPEKSLVEDLKKLLGAEPPKSKRSHKSRTAAD